MDMLVVLDGCAALFCSGKMSYKIRKSRATKKTIYFITSVNIERIIIILVCIKDHHIRYNNAILAVRGLTSRFSYIYICRLCTPYTINVAVWEIFLGKR